MRLQNLYMAVYVFALTNIMPMMSDSTAFSKPLHRLSQEWQQKYNLFNIGFAHCYVKHRCKYSMNIEKIASIMGYCMLSEVSVGLLHELGHVGIKAWLGKKPKVFIESIFPFLACVMNSQCSDNQSNILSCLEPLAGPLCGLLAAGTSIVFANKYISPEKRAYIKPILYAQLAEEIFNACDEQGDGKYSDGHQFLMLCNVDERNRFLWDCCAKLLYVSFYCHGFVQAPKFLMSYKVLQNITCALQKNLIFKKNY